MPFGKWVATLLVAGGSALAVLAGPAVSAAEALSAQEQVALAKRINIAGRQRMLSQRIAKAACLEHMGVDVELHHRMRINATKEFGTVLNGLIHGDAALELSASTAAIEQTQLAKVETLWADFEALALSDDLQTALPELMRRNVPLLKQMNRAVMAAQSLSGDSAMSPDLARTINVAGRQRMLTQKAVKELCQLAAGFDGEAERAALKATVTEFEDTLHDLSSGDIERNIIPAPNWEIEAQVSMVSELWGEAQGPMHTAMLGEPVDLDGLAMVAFVTEAVLIEMNVAVQMYERF